MTAMLNALAEPERAQVRNPTKSKKPAARKQKPVLCTVTEQAQQKAHEKAHARHERSPRAALDFLAANQSSLKLHERQILEEAILQLLQHCREEERLLLAKRVASMRCPPAQLVAELMTDPVSLEARLLIESCPAVREEDLMRAIWQGGTPLAQLVARRAVLPAAVCRSIVANCDPFVLHALVRNPKAEIASADLSILAQRAKDLPLLLGPLAARADLPVPVALELFWHAAAETRRLILERYLTETDQLRRILQLIAPRLSASRSAVEIEAFISDVKQGEAHKAVSSAVTLGDITAALASRILGDRGGEAMAIFLKALGHPRASVKASLERLIACGHLVRRQGGADELLAVSDRMSTSKARTIVTLWNWSETRL